MCVCLCSFVPRRFCLSFETSVISQTGVCLCTLQVVCVRACMRGYVCAGCVCVCVSAVIVDFMSSVHGS